MAVKFYADNHNARFVWSWVDGEHVTSNQVEIENLIGIGLRHEEVLTLEQAKEMVAPIVEPKIRSGYSQVLEETFEPVEKPKKTRKKRAKAK